MKNYQLQIRAVGSNPAVNVGEAGPLPADFIGDLSDATLANLDWVQDKTLRGGESYDGYGFVPVE